MESIKRLLLTRLQLHLRRLLFEEVDDLYWLSRTSLDAKLYSLSDMHLFSFFDNLVRPVSKRRLVHRLEMPRWNLLLTLYLLLFFLKS